MSLLEPFDVCLNNLFKCKMCILWNDWITEGIKPTTPAGDHQFPWSLWERIPKGMVKNYFFKCGISNKLCG